MDIIITIGNNYYKLIFQLRQWAISYDSYFVKKVTKTLYHYVIYRVFISINTMFVLMCRNLGFRWLTLKINPSESLETI